MMDATAETDFEDVSVDAPQPLDLGIGIAWQATDRLALLVDLDLQMPRTIVTVDDDRLAREEEELELAPRASFGVEWEAWRNIRLRGGFLVNRSASKTPRTIDDDTQENYLGGTRGVAWVGGRTETGLGAVFLHADVDTIVGATDPPRHADAFGRLFGALLSISYRL